MVVVITSTGGVSKRVFTVRARRSTPAWPTGPAQYLNERLVGHRPRRADAARARSTTRRWRRPSARSSTRSRRRSPSSPRPPRTRSTSTAPRACSAEHRFQDLVADQRADGDARAARVAARRAARRARRARRATCASAPRTSCRRCSSLALVAAGYGLPQRKLGTVSVIGPMRMDYARAIRTVREAAHELSRFVEDVYEHELHACRATPTRCSASPATPTRPTIKKAFRRLARELHPDVNAHDPRRRGEVQGGRRGLRDPLRRRAPRRPTTATATRACAPAATRPNFEGFGSISRPLRRVLRRARSTAAFGGARAAGRAGRRRRASRSRSTSPRPPRGAAGRGLLRGDRRAASTATATAPSRARRSSPATRCGGAGQLQARHAHAASARSCARSPATCAAATAGSPSSRATTCDGRGLAVAQRARCEVDVPAGIADGQRIRLTGRGHAGERGGAAGRPLRASSACAEDERFLRDGDDLVTVRRRAGAARRAGHDDPGPDARRRRRRWRCPAGTQPGETIVTVAGAGMPPLRAAAAAATCASSSTSSSRAG